MLRPFAMIFGLALLLIGFLGFSSHFVESGNLFGIFRVNFEHNITNLGFGVLGVLCGLYSLNSSRLYFLATGIIYGLLAAVGFLQETDMVFGMIAYNQADIILDGVIAFLSLYLFIRKHP